MQRQLEVKSSSWPGRTKPCQQFLCLSNQGALSWAREFGFNFPLIKKNVPIYVPSVAAHLGTTTSKWSGPGFGRDREPRSDLCLNNMKASCDRTQIKWKRMSVVPLSAWLLTCPWMPAMLFPQTSWAPLGSLLGKELHVFGWGSKARVETSGF